MNIYEKIPKKTIDDKERKLNPVENSSDLEEETESINQRIEEERTYYISWAKSLGKDAEWVDETFTFDENGKVTCKGDLDLRGVTAFVSFPPDITEVAGNVDLRDVTSLSDIRLPETVGGSLYLNRAETLNRVGLPQHVGGAVMLSSLQAIKNLQLPKYVGGGLMLDSLESLGSASVQWPTHIGGDVYLQKLEDWEREQVRGQMEEQGSDAQNRVL